MRKLFIVVCLMAYQFGFSQNNKLTQHWVATGFAMPESVVADPNSNWLYVSNIVNRKTPGYISRVSKNGEVDTYKWLDGLDQPCGLAIYNNKLYVGDQTKVHIIDLKKGKLIKSLSAEGAMTLNDVTISTSGKVYISDVMSGRIYTITNNKLEVWIEGVAFTHPNGLYVDGENLIVVGLGNKLRPSFSSEILGSVYKVNLIDKSVKLVIPGYQLGGLDGVTKVDEKYIVTTNAGGELYAISDKERILLGSFPSGNADLCAEKNVIYIPNFGGKLCAYQINMSK